MSASTLQSAGLTASYDLWLQGHASIATWLTGFGIGCRGSRLVAVEACGGTRAFAQ